MSTDTVKLDDDGIPILDNPLPPDQPGPDTDSPSAAPDFSDHEAVVQLLQNEDIKNLLDDLSEDLQKLVSWKIESLLKEKIGQLIEQAAEQSAPKLAEDIHTQLQLALPGLIAKLIEQSRS